jgi:hypothetical protein
MVVREPTVFAALLRMAGRDIFISDFFDYLRYPTFRAGARFIGIGHLLLAFYGLSSPGRLEVVQRRRQLSLTENEKLKSPTLASLLASL